MTSASASAARSGSRRSVKLPLAPGVTTMVFSPAASTVINATPDAP
jgi:hypothetical protein